MAMDFIGLSVGMGYTDETVIGGGALKGKNCVVSNIEEVADGVNVTFQWTLDDGTVQTNTAFIPRGTRGETGVAGKSAYEIWLEAGNTGTEEDFLISLVGEKGDDGKSAYQYAQDGGYIGTETEFTTNIARSGVISKELEVERARIDNLTTLQDGSTTGDAELIDARIDKDGNTHVNVGEHIRTVSSRLSSEIANNNNNIISETENLFDTTEVLENSFFSTVNNYPNGVLYNANVSISNPIKVNQGEKINLTFSKVGNRAYIITDSADSFVSNSFPVRYNNGITHTFEIPISGYFRLAFFNNESVSITIDGRKRISSINDDFIKKFNIANTDNLNRFFGKTFSVMGDSITNGYGTTKKYTDILNEKLGLSSLYNYGINGSTIASGQNSMATRCTSMNNSDVIIVFGGANDFGCYPTVIGDIYTEENNAKVLNYDVSTFAGAMNTLCKNLLTNFSGKEIYVLSPIHREKFETQPSDLQKNSKGLYIESYIDCMKEVCALWGVKFFNMLKEFPYNPNVSVIKSTYFGTNDGLHLNALGHEKLADTIIKLIG